MVASHARAIIASLTAAVIGFGVFACGDDSKDAGGGGTSSPDPEPLFRDLEADLIQTCGGANGTCHVRGNYQQAPTWLGGPDPYVTIKKYRGVLPATKEVGDSILLTQVKHAGPALADAPNNLYRRVADWLTAEVPGPPLPNTGPFSVQSGFNSLPLDTVASGLTNARLTFLATETNGTLTLSALKLVAPDNANVTIDSPFFVILPRSGKVKADPDVNGFKGELTVAAGQSVDLFTGKMILLRWDPTGRLKIAFNKISSTPGQATPVGCTALELFKSSALPAMGMLVDVLPDDEEPVDPEEPLGQSSCLGCHAKEPPRDEAPAPSVQAMDLRAAGTDPAAACAQAKIWINLQDKAQSTILLNPTGKGNPQHPMKPVGDNDPIIQGLKAWVDAER
ncbi:MAG: hypothetical protein K0S65_1174 [Labilithrix sp.]|nr:hypothetical protein [Labilithrix sp.]